MHAQKGNSAVHNFRSIVRKYIRYCSAASLVDFSKLPGLPHYCIFIEYFSHRSNKFGIGIIETFGMTETNAYGPQNNGEDYLTHPTSAGRTTPIMAVEVRDPFGAPLRNGLPQDGRAADYDDWSTPTDAGHRGLNGDLFF